jgi:hypothetical protein
MSKRVICVAFALIIGGCGGGDGSSSDSSPPGNDLGPPNPDAAPGTDVSVPAPDAAPGTDGGTPPPTDLGADAPTHNPLITSDPDPDDVACGGATCHPSQGEVCCVSMMLGMSCKPASACVGLAAPAYCDGPEDCPGGQHCCVGFPSGAKCNATACSGTSQELCNFDQDCATQHCTPCKGPGSSLVYGLCTTGTTCPSPYTSP